MTSALIIAILSAIAQLFLPWWIIAPIAFGVCYWQSSSAGKAFLEGTASVTLVWAAYAGFLSSMNGGMLSARMGELLFKVPDNPALLLSITPLIGGLVGGIAGLAGFYVRELIQPVTSKRAL